MNRSDFFKRIRQVEAELAAAHLALARLDNQTREDITILTISSVAPNDIRLALGKLEHTYLVRMFAAFEYALRLYLMSVRRRAVLPRTPATHLIRIAAGRLSVPIDTVRKVDEVRELRNGFVHEGRLDTSLTFADCRARINRFLGQLPHEIPPAIR